jgi:signal transduction histidine kinase
VTGTVVFGAFAAHLSAFALARHVFPGAEILLGAAVFGGAWLAGDRTRLRRQRLERERRVAVAEERTRIARDLHDSAGHAINVILVHAGAARVLQDRDPAAVRKALMTIEDVARETLGEIDQLVRTLREGRETEVEPPLGLSGLESLVERQRAAGLDVDLRVHGDRRVLPPALGQAAYRIVQEALTNALGTAPDRRASSSPSNRTPSSFW